MNYTLPFVTVIIPTYKDWEKLDLCLKTLENQSLSSNNFEIIVVNNEINNKVPTDLYLPKNAKLVHEKEAGSYAARNKGIKLAKGDLLAFTDSDCIPDKDWLLNGAKYFKDKVGTERLAGNIRLLYRDPSNLSIAELYESVFAFDQKRYIDKFGASVTANLIVYKALFDYVGLFDSTKKSGEDIQWNRRASSKGVNIKYAEDVIVFHPSRKRLSELSKKRKRVVGGKDYKIASFKDVSRVIKYLPQAVIYNVFPAFYKTWCRKHELSMWQKVKVSYVICHLFGVTVMEYLRLVYNGNKSRR